MNTSQHSLGWDDTIKPAKSASLSNTINRLSLSPENKRKRRHDDNLPPTPHNQHSSHGVYKRTRISVPSSKICMGPHISIRRRLEALDSRELISLVEELVEQQPHLYPVVEQLAPPLTVQQALTVLRTYRKQIMDNMPLGDNQGDYGFLRVRPQWTSFFVALADYTFTFLERDPSELQRTLEFLDGATHLLHEVPHWSSPSNNYLLVRAYDELGQAWTQTLEKGSESLPFALMTGAAWESRFQDHCRRSKGKMSDKRTNEQGVEMVRLCEGVTS